MKTRQRWLLALFGFPLLGVIGFVLLAFGRAMSEQLAWYPRDPAHLEVLKIEHARAGILVTVHAPQG